MVINCVACWEEVWYYFQVAWISPRMKKKTWIEGRDISSPHSDPQRVFFFLNMLSYWTNLLLTTICFVLSFYQLVLFELTQVLIVFLEVIDHRLLWSELTHLSFCVNIGKKKQKQNYLKTAVHIISDKWSLSISSKMKTRPVLTEGNISWLNPRFGDNSIIRDLHNERFFSMLLEHFQFSNCHQFINVNMAGEVLLLCIILFTYYIYITKNFWVLQYQLNQRFLSKKMILIFYFFPVLIRCNPQFWRGRSKWQFSP